MGSTARGASRVRPPGEVDKLQLRTSFTTPIDRAPIHPCALSSSHGAKYSPTQPSLHKRLFCEIGVNFGQMLAQCPRRLDGDRTVLGARGELCARDRRLAARRGGRRRVGPAGRVDGELDDAVGGRGEEVEARVEVEDLSGLATERGMRDKICVLKWVDGVVECGRFAQVDEVEPADAQPGIVNVAEPQLYRGDQRKGSGGQSTTRPADESYGLLRRQQTLTTGHLPYTFISSGVSCTIATVCL